MFTIEQLQNANHQGIHLAKFIARVLGKTSNAIHSRISKGTPFKETEVIEIERAWNDIFPNWYDRSDEVVNCVFKKSSE